jgi:putative spermidine/putrescine transport system ATP-binding protein
MTETTSTLSGEAPLRDAPASGSGLELRNLTKLFAGGVAAVDDVNLHIDHGEYVVLLGPSGCGKTTTLRMIGGHEDPSSGEILLDGQRLNELTPDKRPTTTVFQHFALFPHRTVLENVEFGLKMHGVSKQERRAKALEVMEIVSLVPFAQRRPRELSGGQQQRVALARVLVTKPKALLLDEPLGDLDRLLRLKMRVELRNLQRELGLMFIHVTHDQEEALSVADRVVVMHEGRIAQVGDPFTISTQPETPTVAAFMGDNNMLTGKVVSADGTRTVIETEHGVRVSAPVRDRQLAVGDRAVVSIRSTAISPDEEQSTADGLNELECELRFVEYLGDLVKLHLTAFGDEFTVKVPGDRYPELRGREGGRVRLTWQERDVQLLGA